MTKLKLSMTKQVFKRKKMTNIFFESLFIMSRFKPYLVNVLFSFCRYLFLWHLKWCFIVLLFCPGEERQNEIAQIGHNWSEKISILKILHPLEFIPYIYKTGGSNISRRFLMWVCGISPLPFDIRITNTVFLLLSVQGA